MSRRRKPKPNRQNCLSRVDMEEYLSRRYYYDHMIEPGVLVNFEVEEHLDRCKHCRLVAESIERREMAEENQRNYLLKLFYRKFGIGV